MVRLLKNIKIVEISLVDKTVYGHTHNIKWINGAPTWSERLRAIGLDIPPTRHRDPIQIPIRSASGPNGEQIRVEDIHRLLSPQTEYSIGGASSPKMDRTRTHGQDGSQPSTTGR